MTCDIFILFEGGYKEKRGGGGWVCDKVNLVFGAVRSFFGQLVHASSIYSHLHTCIDPFMMRLGILYILGKIKSMLYF